MKPTLVILAAGMGSRYGGMKQLEPIGPGGETIMDYTVFDAIRAGFAKVVFVIRPDMEASFRASVGGGFEAQTPVAYAFQRLDSLPVGFDVPPGRTKPWGTGHAVLATRDAVREPFAVVNADDFYGASAFAAVSAFLQRADDTNVHICAMVGYTLRQTLTEAGTVNRAICRCSPDGWLRDIVEIVGIERLGNDGRYADENGTRQIISGDTLVSMNMWGFPHVLFDHLSDEMKRFLKDNRDSQDAEFYLPSAVRHLNHAGEVRVKVLPTKDTWCGVTNPQDKARVVEFIRGLIRREQYPERLWQ